MKPLRLREGTKRVEDGSRDETVTESGRHERWWGPGRVCLSVRKAGRRPEESSSESTFYLIAKELCGCLDSRKRAMERYGDERDLRNRRSISPFLS